MLAFRSTNYVVAFLLTLNELANLVDRVNLLYVDLYLVFISIVWPYQDLGGRRGIYTICNLENNSTGPGTNGDRHEEKEAEGNGIWNILGSRFKLK